MTQEAKETGIVFIVAGVAVLLLLLCGCATSEQLAKNLNSKNVQGNGLITDNRIGLDPETLSPVLKSVVVSGDFQTIKSDGNYLNFKREESSAWYNAENKTKKLQLTITASSEADFKEILKDVLSALQKQSGENKNASDSEAGTTLSASSSSGR